MTTIEIVAELFGLSENDASAYIAEHAFYADRLEIHAVVAAIERARDEEREALAPVRAIMDALDEARRVANDPASTAADCMAAGATWGEHVAAYLLKPMEKTK